jgi:hypothetical protein
MSLAVITLVHGATRPDWLLACAESVRERLPDDALHVIVDGSGDFQRARWETYRSAELVACVDHDDLLVGDSLRWCLDALEQSGAGVAFTHEGQIDGEGQPLRVANRALSYRDVAMHPRPLHHLAVIRSACIAPEAWQLAQAFGVGIDWVVRAWVALHHGAVQVPQLGYLWRRHAQQASSLWAQQFETAIPGLRRELLRWLASNRAIPQATGLRAQEATSA